MFKEKSEERIEKENETAKKYANNINVGIQAIKIIDQIKNFVDRTDDEKIDSLSKLRETWLNMLCREFKSYTEFVTEMDKYNIQKQKITMDEVKKF